MKKLLLVLFVIISPLFGFAQNNPVVSWNGRLINNAPSFKPTYLTNTTDSGISSAALSAQDISSTGVGTLSVVSWESFYGTGWPGNSNVDSNKYFSLTIAPKTNYQLALNKLVLTYKGNNKKMRVSYSKNADFSNPTNIEFTGLDFNNTPTIVNVNFPTTVNVTSSETLYIRIYGYDNAVNGNGNGNSSNRYWALQFNANNPSSNVGPTLYGTVTFTPVPQVPVANSDTASTLKNVASTINVLANDIHGTLSAITVAESPTNGTVQVNGLNNITYTPNTNFTGNDTFKYKLVDNIGTSNVATVSIAVNEPTATALVRWNGANLQSNAFLIVNDGSISANSVAGNFVTDSNTNPFPGFRGTNYNTSATTPDYTNYMEFAIKANTNNTINLTDFKFTHARGDGGPQKFEVRYSTDSSIGTAIGGITSVSQTPTLKTINLSGITVQSGQTLYIRVYPFNRENIYWNGGTFHIKHGTEFSAQTPNTTGPTISGTVSVAADPITTWNGASGWSNGTPSTTKDAIIVADYQVASNEVLSVKNLTIKETAVVTVANDGVLLVQNNITVLSNAGVTTPQLIVENNGSFVQVNENATYTGTNSSFTIKRNTQPLFRLDYTYWSSPIKAESGYKLMDLSPNTLASKFYIYNNAWVGINRTEVMVPGKGYIVRAPNGFPMQSPGVQPQIDNISFKGIPNNGVTTAPVTAGQWNLIGNPYPSAVNMDTFYSNLQNQANLEGTIYLWTHNTDIALSGTSYNYSPNDYATYNLSGGTSTRVEAGGNSSTPSGYLAAGQAFFVKGNATGTATFNNAMRVKQGGLNNQFFKPTPSEPVKDWQTTGKHRVWLNLTSAQNDFNQILVGYIENATNQKDWGYDGEVFGGGAVSLYSILDTDKLTVQGRALPFADTDEVPLGYKTTLTGTLKISIDHLDGLLAGKNIYIKDNLLNIVHNLKDSDYSFTTEPGTFNERFVLRYLPEATLGTDIPTINANSMVVFNNNNQISIKSTENTISKIEIYDLQGRVIFIKNNIDAQAFATQSLSASNQMVIVKVTTTDNAELVKKVMLK
jgi:hypothetical protein